MRKRICLIGALTGALATVGLTGVATGARTVNQLVTADICKPTNFLCTTTNAKLPRRKFRAVRLHVVLAARDSTDLESCRVTPDSTPPNERGCRVPPASDNIKVDFDNDIKFKPNSIPKCNPATIAGDDTTTARNQCVGGLIGGGSGFGRFGGVGTVGAGDVPVTISAFNSTNANQIIFHVDPGFAPFDLTGTLVNSPQPGDYGRRLGVPVAAAIVLVRFEVRINKRQFITARCRDRNRKFNFHVNFHYGDTGTPPDDYPSSTDKFDIDKCKRK